MKKLPPPVIYFVLTGTTPRDYVDSSTKMRRWSLLLDQLASNPRRREVLVKWIKHDLNRGKTVLAISDRIDLVYHLEQRLYPFYPLLETLRGSVTKLGRKNILQAVQEKRCQLLLCTKAVVTAFKDVEPKQLFDRVHLVTPVVSQHPARCQFAPVVKDYVDEGEWLYNAYVKRRRTIAKCGWTVREVDASMDATEPQTTLI